MMLVIWPIIMLMALHKTVIHLKSGVIANSPTKEVWNSSTYTNCGTEATCDYLNKLTNNKNQCQLQLRRDPFRSQPKSGKDSLNYFNKRQQRAQFPKEKPP